MRKNTWPVQPGVPAAGHVSGGAWHPGAIDGCSKCDSGQMTVWQSPSGRLHLQLGCTGAGPRNRQRRITVTRQQFDAAVRCRCLRGWRSD